MWTEDLFRVKQPVIALLHLRALPGDPLFDKEGGLQNVIDIARRELHALQDGGVDGILFANEFSLPYQRKVDYVTVASMARVIGELRSEIAVPYGVNIASNPMAAIDLAVATNAQFVRAAFTGAYLSEAGIINTDVAQAVRRRLYLNHTDIKMLFKVNPESDVYLAERSLQKITKSILFHCFPDGLCVSGVSAGSETDDDILKDVKAVADSVPVFCNTGLYCTECGTEAQRCGWSLCGAQHLRKTENLKIRWNCSVSSNSWMLCVHTALQNKGICHEYWKCSLLHGNRCGEHQRQKGF